MVQQITLHLDVPEAHQQVLQRHSLLRNAIQRHTEQLTGIYYDTRRLALRRSGIVLRLRKQGAAWQQTVKHREVSRGGLSLRPEWESPYLGHFDFSSVDDTSLKDWLSRAKIQLNLTPLFEVKVKRTTWKVETAAGGVILVKLDRGWIASSGRRQPISEVELRLVSGTVHDLYGIGTTLSQRIPLTPSLVSKVERGYALFLDLKPAPVKAFAVALDADGTTLAAFRLIALNCLAHLHMNHAGAIVGTDPEYVHQMRVATRRLRAALRMFKPVLAPDFIENLISSLREVMESLGRVRDFDVLMAEIVAPVANALPEDPRLADLAGVITNRLFVARADAARLLSQPQYGLLQIGAGALLHGAPFIDPVAESGQTDTDAGDASLRHFAERRLARLLRKTLKLAAVARSDEPSSLHELRISIKRLRYAIEFFGPMIPGKGAARLVQHLAELQDELGQLNDLASAGAVLMACAGSDPNLREAVALIGGWHGPRHSDLLAAIPDQLTKLAKIKLPRIH
jgi:inorganic triphosphatase YgiF